MNNKLLKDIVKTRKILKDKLKNIKLNEVDKQNLLEDSFKPITKPLKMINEKMFDYQSNNFLKDEAISKNSSIRKLKIEKNVDDDRLDNYQTDYSKTNKDEIDTTLTPQSDNDSFNESSDYYDDAEDYKPIVENDYNKTESTLEENIKLLLNNNQIDKVYGFNIDESGNWLYANNKLKFNDDNSCQLGSIKWNMTPGLFQLLFHSKPLHYTKEDLKSYKEILMTTNAHKRNFQAETQIKGSKSFKYQHIIKPLFDKISTVGSGLLLKSVVNSKPNYIYWDDPNELVDRLRLLLSSESAGHNNHKNEIISIIEELREANIIY